MRKFLDSLKEEVLYEDSDEIPKNVQRVLAKLVYKEPFVAQLFGRGHTDWIVDNTSPTAGVMPHQGRIKFFYNSSFMGGLSEAEINFLLQHELYHIFRSHSSRGQGMGATTQGTHRLMNIAADSLINASCKSDGGFGGLPMKVIKGAWFLKSAGKEYGNVEEHWGKDAKDKYTGSEQTESVYKWMLKRDKGAGGKQPPPPPPPGDGDGPPPPPGPPWEPKVGEVVYNEKTKTYGKVTDIHGGKIKVDEISEKEAETAVSGLKLNKKKKAYRNFLA